MTTYLTNTWESWQAYLTQLRADSIARGFLHNFKLHHLHYKQGLPIGLPVIQRLKQLSSDFNDLNTVNAYSVMRLVIEMDAEYEAVVEMLSSANTINARAMLLVYRFSKGESIDPADLFALSVAARGRGSHDSGAANTALEIGTNVVKTIDLAALLTPILLERPGDPYAQEVACAWIFEHPSPAFVKPLEQCLFDPQFQPIMGAQLTLEKLDPIAAERGMQHLIQTGRATSKTQLWASRTTYHLPD